MHWQAVGGSSVTGGQGLVIRGHPLLEAPLGPLPLVGPSAKPLAVGPLPPQAVAELQALPWNWCGTCATCREHMGR
jgi:hypothetical protein